MEPINIDGLNIPLLQLTYHKVVSDYNKYKKLLNARKYINFHIYYSNEMDGFNNITDYLNLIRINDPSKPLL